MMERESLARSNWNCFLIQNSKEGRKINKPSVLRINEQELKIKSSTM
jgi:hypothetical protein